MKLRWGELSILECALGLLLLRGGDLVSIVMGMIILLYSWWHLVDELYRFFSSTSTYGSTSRSSRS